MNKVKKNHRKIRSEQTLEKFEVNLRRYFLILENGNILIPKPECLVRFMRRLNIDLDDPYYTDQVIRTICLLRLSHIYFDGNVKTTDTMNIEYLTNKFKAHFFNLIRKDPKAKNLTDNECMFEYNKLMYSCATEAQRNYLDILLKHESIKNDIFTIYKPYCNPSSLYAAGMLFHPDHGNIRAKIYEDIKDIRLADDFMEWVIDFCEKDVMDVSYKENKLSCAWMSILMKLRPSIVLTIRANYCKDKSSDMKLSKKQVIQISKCAEIGMEENQIIDIINKRFNGEEIKTIRNLYKLKSKTTVNKDEIAPDLLDDGDDQFENIIDEDNVNTPTKTDESFDFLYNHLCKLMNDEKHNSKIKHAMMESYISKSNDYAYDYDWFDEFSKVVTMGIALGKKPTIGNLIRLIQHTKKGYSPHQLKEVAYALMEGLTGNKLIAMMNPTTLSAENMFIYRVIGYYFNASQESYKSLVDIPLYCKILHDEVNTVTILQAFGYFDEKYNSTIDSINEYVKLKIKSLHDSNELIHWLTQVAKTGVI